MRRLVAQKKHIFKNFIAFIIIASNQNRLDVPASIKHLQNIYLGDDE